MLERRAESQLRDGPFVTYNRFVLAERRQEKYYLTIVVRFLVHAMRDAITISSNDNFPEAHSSQLAVAGYRGH
jgi:hypothetical protein